MKVKELVELAYDVDEFFISNVFDLEDYWGKKHGELEVKSYSIRIDRRISAKFIKESVSMIIYPKGKKNEN